MYTNNSSLICWQKNLNFFWFAWIRKKTDCDSEYGFRPCLNPCETRFVGTHQHITGAEHPSRIENMIYVHTQTRTRSNCECWSTIAQVAATPSEDKDVPGLNPGMELTTHVLCGNWLVLKIASTFKTHVRLLNKNKSHFYTIFCLFPCTPVRLEHGTPLSQTTRSTPWSTGVTSVDKTRNATYLFHVSSGDFTTVEMNAIERTLDTSCSQSLARKRDS